MNSRLLSTVLASACLFLFAGTLSAADPQAIRFVNDWKWEGQAAPLLLALDEGYFAAEDLAVTLDPGTGSVAALPKVASGEYDMGSADINSLIRWRVDHPDEDMQAVFVIYNTPPYAVIGRKSLGVFGPLDLEGHTLGAPSADGAFANWSAFVQANGIVPDRVAIQDVSFAEREKALSQGDVDAVTGFSFTSLVSLENLGVPPEDLSLMLMSDFGLDLYGNVIIVNPQFAEEHPGAVRAFLRAAIQGYQQTISNPFEAVQHVLKRNEEAAEATELRRLIMAIGHHIVTDEVRTLGLGAIFEPRLDKAIAQLAALYEFPETPSATDVFNPGYLPEIDDRQVPTTAAPPAAPSMDDSTQAEPAQGAVTATDAPGAETATEAEAEAEAEAEDAAPAGDEPK